MRWGNCSLKEELSESLEFDMGDSRVAHWKRKSFTNHRWDLEVIELR